MYKAVIFDMDGTILNTIGDLTNAVNYSLAKMGKKHDFSEEKVKLCFGSGIDADMEKHWLWKQAALMKIWNL